MAQVLSFLVAVVVLGASSSAHAQITTRTDAVGKLLNVWQAEGTAAGLSALTYENRDGKHSPLDVKLWPQLQVRSSLSGDTGPASAVRPMPLLGNSSMAAPAAEGGSLTRIYELQQPGFTFLAGQYADNNHFIYPEHQDHDPGWNGRGGWGDLFPANVPMVTTCQGSSYRDQAFLSAYLSAIAALPQETQKLILRKQMLAPTLQSLLRRTYRPGAKAEEDYFTGKAHPVVFDGDQLDEEKMARLAHEMTLDKIPPVVRLAIAGETEIQRGREFFEPENLPDAKLGTTPYAIARVFRGSGYVHEVLLSAERSFDAQDKPLKFKWALLQGDLSRIRIEASEDGVRAKIAVAWHPEMRAASGIQTHRVDIGVFATNGAAWSAPAIVSFYMLPNEARFYDAKGRLEEICYDAANPDPGLPSTDDLRWLSLGGRMGSDQKHPGIALLNRYLSEIAAVRLQSLAAGLAPDQERWRQLSAEASQKKEADALRSQIQQKLREGLAQTFDDSGLTLAQAFESAILHTSRVVDVYLAGQDVVDGLVKASGKPENLSILTAARQRLVDYGIYRQQHGVYAFTRAPEALTAGDRHHLALFHLTVLHLALLPEFLERVEAPAFVDTRLTVRKPWRDVYRYSVDGKPEGWVRYTTSGDTYEFDPTGALFTQGRGAPAVPVKYHRDSATSQLRFEPVK